MKACNTCGEVKASEFFVKHRNLCKACRNAQRRAEYEPKATNDKSLAMARACGLTHYHADAPCKYGHTGLRLVSTQQCCKCLQIRKAGMADRESAKQKKRAGLRRKIAKQLGKTHYISGSPCVNGHTSERLVSNRQCLACISGRPHYPSVRPNREQMDRANAKRRSRVGRARNRKYYREKLAPRLDHRLTRFMRACLRRTGSSKNEQRTVEILGFTSQSLRDHLSKQFTEGMTWENYGEWHIDHHLPISYFLQWGITDPKVVNALSNLRPLWREHNLSKGSRLPV